MEAKNIVRSPSSRNRTSDLRITIAYPLQSSALPTELSKAPMLLPSAVVPLILTKASLQGLSSFGVAWPPPSKGTPRGRAPPRCTEQRNPETEMRAKGVAKGPAFQPWTKETRAIQFPFRFLAFYKTIPPPPPHPPPAVVSYRTADTSRPGPQP